MNVRSHAGGRRRGGNSPGSPSSVEPAVDVDPFAVPAHHFPQIWLLFVSLAALGLAVLDDRSLLAPVFALDRSRVTALIAALVLAGSVHAAWHLVRTSRRIESARAVLGEAADGDGLDTSDNPGDVFVAAWLRDAATSLARTGTRSDVVADDPIERYADRLRSPVDLGWFLVDASVRLGLLGTIIGFILIFGSLSGVSIDGAEGLRELLVAMSGGMGTALFTTLAGLVGATLLSVQYLILGRAAEHLIGLLSRARLALDDSPRAPGTAHGTDTPGDVAAAAISIDRRDDARRASGAREVDGAAEREAGDPVGRDADPDAADPDDADPDAADSDAADPAADGPNVGGPRAGVRGTP